MTETRPFRIALLPLDDRPCSLESVVELTQIARGEALIPPRELLSSHSLRYDFEAVAGWLERTLPEVEAAVLSLDFFLYGGLIRSRKMEITESEALDRLLRLDRILQSAPKVRVYFSHVLLRLSVTVTAEQSEQTWKSIFRYSELSDPVQTGTATPAERAEWEALQKSISPATLEEYLRVRARNHALNRAALGLGGRAHSLVFGQEDCAPRGLHRIEKQILRELLLSRPSVSIMTGADELNSLLVLRAYQDRAPVLGGVRPLPIAVHDPAALERISLYEDISLKENLEAHLAPTAFRPRWLTDPAVSLPPGPVLHLSVFGPEGQKDACFVAAAELTATPLSPSESLLLERFRPGDGLLDCTIGNGASPPLMRELARRHPLPDSLSVFSAWNTSGNRMGTAIAHWGLRALAQERGEWDAKADRLYLTHQLLDGWIYQSEVRPALMAAARTAGANPWSLDAAAWKRASSDVHAAMREQTLALSLKVPEFGAELPWNRFFEVRLREKP